MAVIAPNPTQGTALYNDPSGLDPIDDRLDRRENGAVIVENTECSATGFAKVLDLLRKVVSLVKTALLNVNLAGLANGNILIWNSGAGEWQPSAPTSTDEKVKTDSGGTAVYLDSAADGTTLEVNAAAHKLRVKAGGIANNEVAAAAAIAYSKLSGVAASSHTHAAADVNSGQIGLANGGTGASTAAGARTALGLDTVEAHTANDTLTASEAFSLHTNEGAASQPTLTLPSAAAGYQFRFYIQDSDGLKIQAAAGDTIRIQSSVSSAAGYVRSSTIGSSILLVAVNATEWVAFGSGGVWTVDS